MDFATSIAKFRKDPTLFVTNILNADPDEWQSEVMTAVANGDRPMSGLLASILPVEGIPVMGQSVEGTRMGNLNEVRGLLGDK